MSSADEPRSPSEIPPPALGQDGDDQEPRSPQKRLEHVVRDTIRRGLERSIEAGIGTFSKTDGAIRDLVGDVKLPREVAGYVFSQIDESKNIVVRAVAKEVRDFLDATDIASELQRALTALSFEIKTEVRFIPNEAGVPKADVKSKVTPKVKRNSVIPPPPPPDDETE